MTVKSWPIASLTFVCCLTALLCSCSKGPSESEVVSAIKDKLKPEAPVRWKNNIHSIGTSDNIIEDVKLIEMGGYNKDKKYYPVKVKVKGRCTVVVSPFDNVSLFMSGYDHIYKSASYDEIFNFRFYENDYGSWNFEVDFIELNYNLK